MWGTNVEHTRRPRVPRETHGTRKIPRGTGERGTEVLGPPGWNDRASIDSTSTSTTGWNDESRWVNGNLVNWCPPKSSDRGRCARLFHYDGGRFRPRCPGRTPHRTTGGKGGVTTRVVECEWVPVER